MVKDTVLMVGVPVAAVEDAVGMVVVAVIDLEVDTDCHNI